MRSVQWDVEGRDRPTPYTRVYVRGMWLNRDKQAFEGEQHTLDKALTQQRSGNTPPTRLTRRRLDVRTASVAGMPVRTARPRTDAPVARVLYLHGGGYVHPLTKDYWRLVRSLTSVPAEVVVPAYPLAPDATVDDVLPRLMSLVSAVSADGLPLVVMGDSAGGALSLVIAQQLRDTRGARPAGVVLLSPWLDATLDEEQVRDLEATDPMLAESGLRAAGRWWAGDRSPADPLVSPVNGWLDDLPPLDVYIGDRDILRPAVDLLADRARTSEVALHVHEHPAMFHVWMTRAIPEAARTRHALVELVRRRAGA
ncbi:alpha/beta hydrolase fold domain-containing protein [Aeromicrobium massiliense]|uniref:alpha/beta hydrolase fold domain-containing protein n=1 Tax=Aeromicrobium massiliense TaxID=1464554 RepID=UPI0002D2833C|nr:alpha/beta hydrolase [Aeromicrobium massiliense]